MLDFQVGDVVAGKYEIKKILGAGGMGKVFRARQVDLGRDVALKVPSQQVLESPEIMARFSREARTVAKLTHDNIVQVYEYYHEGGVAFIAMEFVEGQDLKEFVAKPPSDLTVGDLAKILELACEGMAAAHEHGIIHRDIKPHNIMVARAARGRWRVKVMDFGIAHIDGAASQMTGMGDGQLTQTGQALGTPSYMSPEQIRGSGVTHLSDIYSFGCVIYYSFTKNTVFQGSGLTVAVSHLNEQPPSVKVQSPLLPDDFDKLILKCLEKDPARRPQTAIELGQAITVALASLGNQSMDEVWRSAGMPADATIPILGGIAQTGTSTPSPGTGQQLVEVQTQGTLPQGKSVSVQVSDGGTVVGQKLNESKTGIAGMRPTGTPVTAPRVGGPSATSAGGATATAPPGAGATATSIAPSAPAPSRSGGSSMLLFGVLGLVAVVALAAGVFLVISLTSDKKIAGEGPDVVPTPTPIVDQTPPPGTPRPEQTQVAVLVTPRSTEPTPLPSPTPDLLRNQLNSLKRDLGETKNLRGLVRLWTETMALQAKATDPAFKKEVLEQADATADRIVRNPEMVAVEAGTFTMGQNDERYLDEGPEHNVQLNAYSIGKYEVTAVEFATFLNANAEGARVLYEPKPGFNITYDENLKRWVPVAGRELHPANGITWKAASRYAEWLSLQTGKTWRLPTEAEWERAARGTRQNRFPWGPGSPTSTTANFNNPAGTVPVIELESGATAEGVLNMAGNVAEWCADWYAADTYKDAERTGNRRENPVVAEEPTGGRARRLMRGGSFASTSAEDIVSSRRDRIEPDRAEAGNGFRLVLTP